MKFFIIVFLCILATASPICGQSKQDTLPKMLLLDEQLQAELADALDKMYNFDFALSEKEFLRIRRRYPEHPLPYFLMGLSQWWKMMPNTDITTFDKAFEGSMDTAIGKAEKMYKLNPKNTEASFFLAAAYGFKGRFYSDREQWLRAASAGKSALNYLKRGKSLNDLSPEFMFGDALFNYYVVWIPENYPILAPIVSTFPKGNKELGIKQLDEVSRKAFYTRIMASYFLMFIYNGEGKTYLTEPIAKKMYEAYPENPYFHRVYAISTFFTGRRGEAEKLAKDILEKIEKKQFGYEAISGRFASYILGEVYMYSDTTLTKKYFEKTVYFAESIAAYDSGYYHAALEWLYKHHRQKNELEQSKVYLSKLAKYAEKKNSQRKGFRKELKQLKRSIRKEKKIERM